MVALFINMNTLAIIMSASYYIYSPNDIINLLLLFVVASVVIVELIHFIFPFI